LRKKPAKQPKKEEQKEEEEPEGSFFEFEKYFKPSLPVPKGKMKHKYTVEITRAMYTDESFAVYQAYQLSIHKEKKEERNQYENFLC
jgi:arginyl-tRNA--protein-N-Asp/Glu arginylyltransferase